MYILTVHKKGDFIMEIHQEDVRCHGAKEYIDIGVSVLKANETYGELFCLLIFEFHVLFISSFTCLFVLLKCLVNYASVLILFFYSIFFFTLLRFVMLAKFIC